MKIEIKQNPLRLKCPKTLGGCGTYIKFKFREVLGLAASVQCPKCGKKWGIDER